MTTPSATADPSRIYNELLVTTAEHVHPRIRENAIDAHPGASIFLGKIGAALNSAIGDDGAPAGTGARAASGGDSIRVNVKLGKNSSGQWLSSGYSQISLDTSDTARGSRANWKLWAGSVVMDGSSMRKNSGPEQITELLLYKQQDTVSSGVDAVAEAIMASAAVPNAVTPLDAIISANDSLQDLSGTTFTDWNSRGLTSKGTAPASIDFDAASGGGGASFASAGISNWNAAYMNATEGSIKPNAILTTDAIFRFYEGSLTSQVRYTDLRMGDIGFQALSYKNVPVFHDPYVPSGVTYFLNTNELFFQYLPGALFDLSPMERGQSQDVFAAHVLLEGNLVTRGRKYNNKITGQTA